MSDKPTIVVGVDGSEHSKRALRWAADEARLRDARLKAVCAWTYPYVVAAGSAMPIQVGWDALHEDATELLTVAVDEALSDYPELEVEQIVVEGSAGRVLTEAATGAELLVVGSRGHGGFAGLLLGSVSQQCANHAPCPVVVVRPEAVRGRPEPAVAAQAST